MIDKYGVLQTIHDRNSVFLELGVGSRKRVREAIGIDMLDTDSVDIVGDALEVLLSIRESSVDGIYSWHFLEHVPNVKNLLSEMARVLKPGGEIKIVVPHFSNPHFYSDPTHKTYFGLYTFCYYSKSMIFKRETPDYSLVNGLVLEDIDLVFKAVRPFYFRRVFKKTIGWLFNSTHYLQEWYEENLCWIFPCYEISYKLTVKK